MSLTVDALIRSGYLHNHAIPPLTTELLADCLPKLPSDPTDVLWKTPAYSRCCPHSVPKKDLARRTLAIPNPQHQIPLCMKLQEHWAEIEAHCKRSPLSLTTPIIQTGAATRALAAPDFGLLAHERTLRSIGCRYHLYADLNRFYGSIYSHSISWALHGKETARKDRTDKLAGNQIDKFLRATQDRQSVGIPIGPDSSQIIAEVVATSIDLGLPNSTHGARFVDDYHLYFRSQAECERSMANLHTNSRLFELEVNDSKSVIEPLPDVYDPRWKLDLREYPFKNPVTGADLQNFFGLAFEHHHRNSAGGVLSYAVRRSEELLQRAQGSQKVRFGELDLGELPTSPFGDEKEWRLYQALLFRCLIAEPSCFPAVNRGLQALFLWHQVDVNQLRPVLESICLHHAPLQNGYEVAWAIWTAILFSCPLSDEVADVVSRVDDDTVALTGLHAREQGLLGVDKDLLWRHWLTKSSLNSEHWLFAYEAPMHGWVEPDKHIGGHPFFKRLRDERVFFYLTEGTHFKDFAGTFFEPYG